ncbi:HEAT repeat domain-containing protein [Engelhardtia mirabilis]|uniref:HEAT repeat protein n=1 Tax=Engelhardtia mirabilis TaxID=2528011 RepID=A0A518BN87_9BACT|nr:hypothetical protein Pla133_35450 [Planctomycetes bacterium Pla133]QDV02773.1 hypothetical protein Pla86_35430 [Planctomycetes bacterium Pla86]
MRSSRSIYALAGWLVLAPLGAALQLDLPRQMNRARSDQGDRKSTGDLVLPRNRGTAEAPEATEAPTAEADRAPTLGDVVPTVGDAARAAELVASLAAMERYDSSDVAAIAAQLEVLGESGLRAARASLTLDATAPVVASARVLLRSGGSNDREALGVRLAGKLPGGAPAPLLEAIAAADPTFLDDATLVELLDHRQGAMRAAAQRVLEERSRAALLPSLMPALRSERTDTRVRALDLVAGVDDDAVVPLLFDRLDDESAQVAFRAAELLSEHPSESIVPKLCASVRSSTLLFRDSAYALLAIVEREDRAGVAILGDEYIPQLLENLRGPDPFVRSVAAVALAGIGFRSESREGTEWLDLEVPHQLVGTVMGDNFHADFGSVQLPARRRLARLTGERFGADGPAWARWWTANAKTFKARRATILVQPGDEGTLSVAVRGTVTGPEAFVLVGPQADEPEAMLGEVLYVGPEEALALTQLLAREGVFGRERLPGQYGSGGGLRTLEVAIAGQSKRFTFAGVVDEPWFDAVLTMARDLRDRNVWQRYYDSGEYATRREFWTTERGWWLEPRTELERQRRLKDLALGALSGALSGERDQLLEDLEELCRVDGALVFADFATLRVVLRKELIYGSRADRITGLALRAADGGQGVDPVLARELFDELYELFRETSMEGLKRTVAAAPVDLARDLSTDPRALARAIAAGRMATSAQPIDLALLRALLDDDQDLVQAAAVEAVGAAGLEDLRTEVLVRARIGPPVVRTAALRAAGQLGGEGARDAMMSALGADDATLQRAAVEGLAALRDPATAALLASFVRRGPGTPHYAPARAGLLALGERSWPELRQLAQSDRIEARREAGLLLSEQGAAEAAPTLIEVLLADPNDARVAHELAVLTCVDLREGGEPGRAWAAWWEHAVQDDALAWFRGAQERASIAAAPIGSLEGNGTREGALSLIETLSMDDPLLVERARRELSRLLGRVVQPPPASELRAEWRDLLRSEVESHFG